MRFALAEECKALYAKENNISFEKLVRDRGFKELHRTAMTQYFWEKGVSFFEDKTLEKICNTVSQVFIITDFRLKSLYEKIPLDRFNVKTVRVNCSIDQREKRGFKFDESKDTDITETGLDQFPFDTVLDNSGTLAEFESNVVKFCESIIINQKSD